MDVVNAAFNIAFDPDPQIRRYAYDFEVAFQDDFIKPYTVFPVPDDASPEIPRIVAVTQEGHSQLAINARSAQISTVFDRNYSGDAEQCLEYSKKKALDLQEALAGVEDLSIQFSGLSVTLALLTSDGKSPIEHMEEKYLRISGTHPLADATLRLVYEIDDEYYFNLETREGHLDIGPYVDFRGIRVPAPTPQDLIDMKELVASDADLTGDASERLVINIDFNNRLAFNHGMASGCTTKTVNGFYSRVLSFIGDGLAGFVDNAEVAF